MQARLGFEVLSGIGVGIVGILDLLKVEVPEGSQGVSDMPGGQLQVNYED